MFQGWSFLRAIHHTLLHYRATQHSTTGVSPAFLMLGRELHLPLDRLSPALPQEPLPEVRASVTRQQRRMKQKFDFSAHVKVPDIKAADWVRVRRPHRDNKLASYWSVPLQVTHQLGPATFLLSDGTRWHGKPSPQSAAPGTYNRRRTSSHTPCLAGHPSTSADTSDSPCTGSRHAYQPAS